MPIARMQPAITACWTAYVNGLGLAEPSATTALLRAVSYAAARLVVTAFEVAQTQTALDSNLFLHLQLAFNILDRPREAAAHLLGLTTGRGPR